MFAEPNLLWWAEFLLRILGAVAAAAAIILLLAGAASTSGTSAADERPAPSRSPQHWTDRSII